MKTVLLLLALFTGMAAFQPSAAHATQVQEAQPDLYANLSKAWRQRGVEGVKAILNSHQIETYADQQTATTWLQNNYEMDRRNPRIGLLYADALYPLARDYKMARKESEYHHYMLAGLTAFLSSQLIAYEDIARCADKSVGAAYAQSWREGKTYETYKVYAASLSKEQRQSVWESVKKISDGRDKSEPDKTACAGGAEALAAAQMKGDCQSTGLDKTDMKCDEEKYIEILNDDQWQALRLKVQAAVMDHTLKGNI
ncbi:MAG: hypothetical protein DI551_10100 [Micavibrio aeruginosavorus]|uniref:Uncharacterized protein n=1 Tax=Micavibrio aeruginosavorus TaxID=349221 RepID=A0A2W5N0Q0_9BACT|nr:MAG: hypothetical protein DI551_10100 [Micavibrio aeruginosavorus]